MLRPQAQGVGSLFATYIDPALNRTYPLTYYPNAAVSEEAEPISLAAGSQVVASFQLHAIKPTVLAVHLERHAEASRTELTLYREVFGTWERTAAEQATEPGGGLLLSGVAPGTYRLQQTDADSRSPGPQRTIKIAGQASSVVLESRLSEATVTVKGHGDVEPNRTTVGLILDGADPQVMQTAPFDEHQTAVLRNVQPGHYLVVAGSLEAGQKAGLLALIEGGKVKEDQHLEVKSGSLRADVTLGHTVKSVDGMTEAAGKARPGAMVVLVPAGADTRRELFRRDQSDLDGSFTFFNVLPGRYLVVALDDAWNLAWDDVAVLTPYLLHATPVDVLANGAIYHMRAAVCAQVR